MRDSIRKTVVAAIAALGMAAAAATISTPAQAQWHGGGGFHGGGFHGGGWGGGGWRGGGWHGGGWRGGGWHGGWGGGGWGWRRAGWGPGWGGGWGGGCWNCGWGWGGGWGWDPGWAIAAATVPIGVAIASQPAYGGGPGCWVRRRVWTEHGHYLGRRLVNICY
jgi:hypothetical protein